MAAEPAPANAAELRSVTRDVADADCARVMRVVATVDAMWARGSADQLIAPLRHRLGTLRPPRPLRFVRLMFQPLAPLIVSAGRWRPNHNTIPRTALVPLADCVREAMGAEAREFDAAIAGRTTADTELAASRGRVLWSAAGTALMGASVPQSWEGTGLGITLFTPLARRVGALLTRMDALDRLCAETAGGLMPPRTDKLHAILKGVSEADGAASPMMVTLLLLRLPATAALMMTGQAESQGPAMAEIIDELLDQLVTEDGAGARIEATGLSEAAAAVRRMTTLLRELEGGTVTAARRMQLALVRQNLDSGCRARFAAGLHNRVLKPLGVAGFRDVPDLEAAARDLRALETEARSVGGASAYDLMLREAAETIKASSADAGLKRTDQIRLVEILAGPDAALAMLDEGRGGA